MRSIFRVQPVRRITPPQPLCFQKTPKQPRVFTRNSHTVYSSRRRQDPSTSPDFSRSPWRLPATWRLAFRGLIYGSALILLLAPLSPISVRGVNGESMTPALRSTPGQKDFLFFKPLFPGPLVTRDKPTEDRKTKPRNEVARGQLVLLTSVNDPEKYVVKRVIGIPGDAITPIEKKRVDSKQDGGHMYISPHASSVSPVTVPYGYLWVEGDNPSRSLDSNDYGPVSQSLVQEVAYGRAGFPWRRRWQDRKWKRVEWEKDGWDKTVQSRLKKREDVTGWKGEGVPERWQTFE